MRYNQRPVHRRLIIPWYDSSTLCILLLIFLMIVFIFAIIGIIVSKENNYEYVWVPVFLSMISGAGVISTTVRIFRRLKYKF